MVRSHHIWHKCRGHTQLLGHCWPIWYPASAAFDCHTGRPHLLQQAAAMEIFVHAGVSSAKTSAQTSAAPDTFFTARLAEADPRSPRRSAASSAASARDRADRLGEHRLRGGARGAGLGADQQVRRGLSGQALLRRLRVRRHRRDAGDRAGEEAVRLPASPTSSRTPAAR